MRFSLVKRPKQNGEQKVKKTKLNRGAEPAGGGERSVSSTSLECEQRWHLLQSEAREEIAAHQRTSPQTRSVVDDHLGLGC
ncbi:hypothetical protein ATANTOWER_003476 [Ataeniobius toweri]|uniref:Uncharacterized protein n=1 Tax=Ataeniobius toweri TaxID=208326 RepID=A0ABU7B4H5_9TELE|nr:hypothetical protein [Ataeniobius toweri]